jgi:hypothetical protein
MKEKDQIQHVFWTGGLDSTYRVIFLLLNTELPVRPHYIIRHEESTGSEIDAMNDIRRAFARKYPESESRFLPTMYVNEDLIPSSEEIDEEIEKLRKEVRVHEQYQILANYCRAHNIEKIDLTYERDITQDEDSINVSDYFGVNPALKSFHNPHKKHTKKEYFKLAKKEGWDDLLKMTFFCRRPKLAAVPCGMCGPCTDAVANGVGFRLPLRSRIKARIVIPFRNYYRKNYHKHDTGIFKYAKRKLEHRL